MTKSKMQVIESTQPAHRTAIQAVRSALKARFFERDQVIDGMLVALLAKQHVLLLGPPGTAKSDLTNALTASIDGARFFGWLLTKFSTPEELFGPVSLNGLKNESYRRITTGKLPEAEIGFLDEIFKGNSAILNALLTLVNERVYHNDGKPTKCPLLSVIGASNETPEGAELTALYDRFALRFHLPYMAEGRNLNAYLRAKAVAPVASATPTITLTELTQAQDEVRRVQIPDRVFDVIVAIKRQTEAEGFVSSDRRWGQLVSVVQATAYLDGRDVACDEDLEVLAAALWNEPKDRAKIAGIVLKLASPVSVRTAELVDMAKESIRGLPAVDPADPRTQAEWMRAASLTIATLDRMIGEVNELRKAHSTASATSKLNVCEVEVLRIKTNLVRDVAKQMGIK